MRVGKSQRKLEISQWGKNAVSLLQVEANVEQAMEPADFKPIYCKWDDDCVCFHLAAQIT